MILEPIHCPDCNDAVAVIKHGKTLNGKQRYLCQNPNCDRHTLFGTMRIKATYLKSRRLLSEMAINGSSIRDTARVLKISPTTVIEELKKSICTSKQ